MHAMSITHPAQMVSPQERRSSFAWAVAVGVIAAGIVLLIALAWITLANTNATVNDVKNAQTNHTATLRHIDALSKEVKAEVNGLKSGNAEVSKLLVVAGTTAAQLKSELGAVCQATHANC